MNRAIALTGTYPVAQADPTYPRPILRRQHHALLDRTARFTYDDKDEGLGAHWERYAEVFERTIHLPFAPETSASGIGDHEFHPVVWYRIELTEHDLDEAGHAPTRRLLLHFGAVDYEATVWVDGRLAGTHIGGQSSFCVDISDCLNEGPKHVVVVRAADDPHDLSVPRGKQDWLRTPHAIWYHRTTGIWRTVWLESVPNLRVDRLVWRPRLIDGQVEAIVELNRRPDEPTPLDIAITHGGRTLCSVVTQIEERSLTLSLPLTGQHNGVDETLMWSPENPVLLDAAVVLGSGSNADSITSYIGYRDIRIDHGQLLLNGRPLYLRSVLEQGYWEHTGLTPPSIDDLYHEVELIQSLGFNCARIHQKVEDPRFHFFADQLGLLLWGETAAAYAFDSRAVAALTTEWIELIRAYESHPSIITWVPFNESWGVTRISYDSAQQAFTRGVSDLTRALDPTRPVVSNDGWEHTDSDILTIHDYEWRGEVLAQRYGHQTRLTDQILGPAGRWMQAGTQQRNDVPLLLTEFGGVSFVDNTGTDTWGYSSATDEADYERRLREIMSAVRSSPALSGYCWTQLTDTFQEANGLCHMDRTPKLPPETIRRLMGPDAD